ncbi:MAG TPA: HIT domain-containing protein [Phycisphaerae bacterium]|nr:HIT domain-containing protein [Phycisphaerae bacterium]
MAEQNQNLWAPWRLEYIQALAGTDDGCFLCRYAAQPEQDGRNRVIWRGATCLTIFNQFPYNNGHLLIAPLAHLADLEQLDDPTLDELIRTVRDAKRLLQETLAAHGFNVGMNFGRCAGAGLPGHLHAHIVPRWDGDTNFMAVVGNTRVISQSIEALREQMRQVAASRGLPPVRG